MTQVVKQDTTGYYVAYIYQSQHFVRSSPHLSIAALQQSQAAAFGPLDSAMRPFRRSAAASRRSSIASSAPI